MTFKRSNLTDVVIDALRGVNDEISYVDLARRCKSQVVDVRKVLPSARKILMQDKILFEPIIGYGLKRLDDSGKITRSEKNKKRIKAGARRSVKELETVNDYSTLSPEDQIKMTLNRTLFEIILREKEPVKEHIAPTEVEMPINVIHIPKKG